MQYIAFRRFFFFIVRRIGTDSTKNTQCFNEIVRRIGTNSTSARHYCKKKTFDFLTIVLVLPEIGF